MPLPGNLSEWEHLSDLIRRYHNREVQEEFSDVPEAGDPNTIDWNIPRQQLRHAVTIKDEDTDVMLFLRLWLFYVNCRKASDFHPAMYTIPAEVYQSITAYKPQVMLYYRQDLDSVPPGKSPKPMQVSYTLMNESSSSMNLSKATSLANEIRTAFGNGGGHLFDKGKILLTYKDLQNGFNFQIYARSETEGRELITKVMSLSEKTINNDLLVIHTPQRSNTVNPGTHVVFGKTRNKYDWRPNIRVRFQYASLKLHGLPHDVILYDRSGYWKKAIIKHGLN